MNRRVPLARRDVVDLSLAAVLLAASLVDLFTTALNGTYPHGRWVHLPFIVVTSLPVAFRRRSPLVALISFAVLQSTWIYLLYPLDVQPPLIPFVQLLVIVYSAAAYADGRASRAAWVVVAIGVATDLPSLFAGKPLGQVVGPDIMIAIAFGVGLAFASARRQNEANALELARAEVERRDVAERAAAAERSRIARELHDVISHDVSMMVLQASVERRVRGSDDETDRALESIETTGREALSELRRMLGVLHHRPSEGPLRPQPGLAHIAELVDQSRAAGIRASLVVEGEDIAVPPGLGIAAYRIVQESLTNAAKHATGSTVTATVRFGPDVLEVEVVDAGPARGHRPPVPSGGGHGLVGMRERVALFGGTLDADHAPDGGFRVRARLPLPA